MTKMMTKMTRLKITLMSIRFDPRYSDVAKTDILSLQNLALNITKQPNMRMNSFARVSKKQIKAIFIVANYIFFYGYVLSFSVAQLFIPFPS